MQKTNQNNVFSWDKNNTRFKHFKWQNYTEMSDFNVLNVNFSLLTLKFKDRWTINQNENSNKKKRTHLAPHGSWDHYKVIYITELPTNKTNNASFNLDDVKLSFKIRIWRSKFPLKKLLSDLERKEPVLVARNQFCD